MDIRFNQTIIKTAVMIFIVAMSLNTSAHNKVVVVPLGSDAQPLENVITVSTKNGDYTTIQAAISSFVPGNTPPTVVYIGPGLYTFDSSITIPPQVSLVGSGTYTTTLLATVSSTGNINDSAALVLSGFSTASNFTLTNQGGLSGDTAVGIVLGSNTILSDVIVSVSSFQVNAFAIYKNDISSAQLYDSLIIIDNSGTNGTGIYVSDGTLFVNNTDVYVGVSLSSSASNIGVQDTASGTLFMRQSKVEAAGTNSTGIIINKSDTNIIQTQVNGITTDITDNVGGTNCIDLFDNDLIFHSPC